MSGMEKWYKEWLKLSAEEKRTIFSVIAARKAVSDDAIEKDWWVTVVLSAIFGLTYGKAFVFKGGTSLSKGWDLIQRFSEDIDLAIDREFLGFTDDLNKSQRTKLRKQSKLFVENILAADLRRALEEYGMEDLCEVEVPEDEVTDRDPVVLYVRYKSIVENGTSGGYMANVVKIEISCRSMLEPYEEIMMRSMVADAFPQEAFAEQKFVVQTVRPERTFLEKAFLLHEEFNRRNGCSRVDRLTRHMYDLERMMDMDFAIAAINDTELYNDIVNHRKTFTAWSGLDYSRHSPEKIAFVPPASVHHSLQDDYQKMQQNFIYGQSLSFDELLARMEELQQRFRACEQARKSKEKNEK